MTVRTAGEILERQLDVDVAEAKQALIRELLAIDSEDVGGPDTFANAIENLIGKVVSRWWMARLRRAEEAKPLDPTVLNARRNVRMNAIVAMLSRMKERSGAIDIDGIQLQQIGMAGELLGIWALLCHMGFSDETVRQDYLDHGVAMIANRAFEVSDKVVVPG